MSLRRIPPPPPPGFGDEEYYRLYGRPEDYHRQRSDLEKKMKNKDSKSADRSPLEPGEQPDDEDDDENKGEPHTPYKPWAQSPLSYRPSVHQRIGYSRSSYNFDPKLPLQSRRYTEVVPRDNDELGPLHDRRDAEYENFQVTFANKEESEGTPSLSGIDDDEDSGENAGMDDPVEKSRRSAPVDHSRNQHRSAKERLGKRIRSPTPESLESTISSSDSESETSSESQSPVSPRNAKRHRAIGPGSRESLPKRSSNIQDLRIRVEERKRRNSSLASKELKNVARSKHETKRLSLKKPETSKDSLRRSKSYSPIKKTHSSRNRNHSVKHRRHRSKSKSCSPIQRNNSPRSRNHRERNRRRRESVESVVKSSKHSRCSVTRERQLRDESRSNRHRRRHRESRSDNRRKKSPVRATGTQKRSKTPRRGSKRLTESESTKTSRENEAMLRNLARKQRNGNNDSRDVQNRLAKLAGIRIPENSFPHNPSNRRKRSPRRRKPSRSPSESSSDTNDSTPKRSSSRAGKLRSDRIMARNKKKKDSKCSNQVERSRARGRSPGRWKHDKYTAESPINHDSEKEFGNHWNRIRSERSKEMRRLRHRDSSRSVERSRRRRNSSYSSSSRSRSRSGSRCSKVRGRKKSLSSSDSRNSSGSTSRNSDESVFSESESSRSASNSSRSSSSSGTSRSSVSPRRRHIRRTRVTGRKLIQEQKKNISQHSSNPKAQVSAAEKTKNTQSSKDGVNMQTSGKLLEDTNVINGIVVKYSEPPEAKKPLTKWRLYVFKGNEELPILYIHRQSAYLLGRDRKVSDIPLDHPSCSKQHAVLQYRLIDFSKSDGSKGRKVTPYVIDLGSANGTYVNNQKIEERKYVQLIEKDVLRFGFSSREYVLLHDQSKEREEEDEGVD